MMLEICGYNAPVVADSGEFVLQFVDSEMRAYRLHGFGTVVENPPQEFLTSPYKVLTKREDDSNVL